MTTATGFRTIVGQQHPIALLKTLIASDKLPHALLFTGDEGVGKKSTAKAFAMVCNCINIKKELQKGILTTKIDACGECIPCKKIAGNHHPDVIHINPQSSAIKISQIRTLLQALTLKPNEAVRRVVILSEAHCMNTQAANALLKILEEPPARTLIVLTASHPTNLLPTVASRCRHIRFFPLGKKEIKHLLSQRMQLEPDTLETVAALSQGSFSRAKKFTDPRWINRRSWIIRTFTGNMVSDDSLQVLNLLAFSESLVKNKEWIEESLEVIAMWLRDLLMINHDPEQVINRDFMDTLSAIGQSVNPKQVLKQVDAVECAMTAMKSNTNIRLTMDAMVMRMAAKS